MNKGQVWQHSPLEPAYDQPHIHTTLILLISYVVYSIPLLDIHASWTSSYLCTLKLSYMCISLTPDLLLSLSLSLCLSLYIWVTRYWCTRDRGKPQHTSSTAFHVPWRQHLSKPVRFVQGRMHLHGFCLLVLHARSVIRHRCRWLFLGSRILEWLGR